MAVCRLVPPAAEFSPMKGHDLEDFLPANGVIPLSAGQARHNRKTLFLIGDFNV
jgi:hypothetical protein